MKNFSAFTLAEVLITLGVIGVVAALTIPTLMAKYDEMVTINKIKRSYSEIANAIEMRKAELGVSDYASVFDTSLSEKEQLDGIVKYLNVVERCDYSAEGCGGIYKIKPKTRSNDGFGNIAEGSLSLGTRAVLQDGTIIRMSRRNFSGNDCTVTYTRYNKDENGNYTNVVDGKPVPEYYNATSCAEIFFDVDGPKGKNQFGYDNYSFNVEPNKLMQHVGYGALYDTMRTGKLTAEKYAVGGKF